MDAGADDGQSADAASDGAERDATLDGPTAPDADTDATSGDAALGDLDMDGLDDAYEARVAGDYLPFLSMDPADGCALGALVFRVRPHPMDGRFLLVNVVHLFQNDCGALGHVGDNEAFSMTVDPATPGPEGILAIRAISHRNTACQAITDCGHCPGLDECTYGTRRGVRYPVVFYSKDKHGSYTSEPACDGACVFTNYCLLAGAPTEPPMLDVGEPAAPLTHDLTDSGLITSEAGWTEMALFHFDPWGTADFGDAGSVVGDLIDDAWVTPVCTL